MMRLARSFQELEEAEKKRLGDELWDAFASGDPDRWQKVATTGLGGIRSDPFGGGNCRIDDRQQKGGGVTWHPCDNELEMARSQPSGKLTTAHVRFGACHGPVLAKNAAMACVAFPGAVLGGQDVPVPGRHCLIGMTILVPSDRLWGGNRHLDAAIATVLLIWPQGRAYRPAHSSGI